MLSAVMTSGGGAAAVKPAVGEQVHTVAIQRGKAEVVEGREDGHALAGDDVEDVRLVADVEVVRGLVEHDVVGPLGQRPGDQDELLLTTRQRMEAAADEVAAADGPQRVAHHLVVVVRVPFESALAGESGEHHHLLDPKIELHRRFLAHHRDAPGGCRGGGRARTRRRRAPAATAGSAGRSS